jgi:hypothetical protein
VIVSAAPPFLAVADGDPVYELWYRRIWDFVAAHLTDLAGGGGNL